MRLGKYLSELTKPELEELKDLLNLSDEEEKVFNELSKGRSKIFVADRCKISTLPLTTGLKAYVPNWKD